MYWDRFDICEAYWCFYCDWHRGGLTDRDYEHVRSISETLHRLQFQPSADLSSDTLNDNARAIYDALVDKYHP